MEYTKYLQMVDAVCEATRRLHVVLETIDDGGEQCEYIDIAEGGIPARIGRSCYTLRQAIRLLEYSLGRTVGAPFLPFGLPGAMMSGATSAAAPVPGMFSSSAAAPASADVAQSDGSTNAQTAEESADRVDCEMQFMAESGVHGRLYLAMPKSLLPNTGDIERIAREVACSIVAKFTALSPSATPPSSPDGE